MRKPRVVASLDGLAGGAGNPVLIVDFLRFAAARSLGSVLAEGCGDRPVLRADPVGDLPGGTDAAPDIPTLADAYAAAYANTPAVAGRPALVVGYCSAAVLALRLAERLAQRGLWDGVVLVQPTWPNLVGVQDEFRSLHAQWAPAADPPQANSDRLGHDPVHALDGMMSVLRTAAQSSTRARGLDTPAGRALLLDLFARYRAWLGFQLTAAHEIRDGPAPRVSFRTVGGVDDLLDAPWPLAGPSCAEYLDVPGDELLEAPGLARAVVEPRARDRSVIP